jgi:carbonic anhydrase/acetyltransferase-like protein (isoleucine patch superfamily)
MAIYRVDDRVPNVPASAYVAPQGIVIGQVTLGEHVSVWPGAVVRADDDTITIGDNNNVQDGAVLHIDRGCPMVIGANVTIGHQAMLHGCTIGDGTLVGIQAFIYNREVIGRNCLIGAGAVITEGKEFPDGSLIVGAPAKLVRALTPEQIAGLRPNIDTYVKRAAFYRAKLVKIAD